MREGGLDQIVDIGETRFISMVENGQACLHSEQPLHCSLFRAGREHGCEA